MYEELIHTLEKRGRKIDYTIPEVEHMADSILIENNQRNL